MRRLLPLVAVLVAAEARAQGFCSCDCPVCEGGCSLTYDGCACGYAPACSEGAIFSWDYGCGPTCNNGEASVGGDCPWPACGCTCVPTGSSTPGSACDDGNPCTVGDTVDAGCACVGTPIDCDDDNPCTTDVCGASGCLYFAVPDGLSCSDLDDCDGGETCEDGSCIATIDPLDCDDGDPCTSDACVASTCFATPAPDGLPCASDGDACNGPEACAGGACLGGAPLLCDDGDPCTDDWCDPATGCASLGVCGCTTIDDCSDGNACNGPEACEGGACAPGEPADCDDGDDCTVDGCDPAFGCAHTTPPDSPCACLSLPVVAGDPDSPSPVVVVDGSVTVGVEYPGTPVGVLVTGSGAAAASAYAAFAGGEAHLGAVPMAGTIAGAAIAIDLDGDDVADASGTAGDDLDGDGRVDVIVGDDGDGAEFVVPGALVRDGVCPHVAIAVWSAGSDVAWWPGGGGEEVQCVCGPAPGGGDEGEGEGEGGGGGGGDDATQDDDLAPGFYAEAGCCRVGGAPRGARASAALALLLAMALVARRRG